MSLGQEQKLQQQQIISPDPKKRYCLDCFPITNFINVTNPQKGHQETAGAFKVFTLLKLQELQIPISQSITSISACLTTET